MVIKLHTTRREPAEYVSVSKFVGCILVAT